MGKCVLPDVGGKNLIAPPKARSLLNDSVVRLCSKARNFRFRLRFLFPGFALAPSSSPTTLGLAPSAGKIVIPDHGVVGDTGTPTPTEDTPQARSAEAFLLI